MASHALRGVFAGRIMPDAVRCRSPSATARRELALKRLGQEFHGRISRRALATAAMSEEQLAGLRVSQDRLMEDLHHSCQWGHGTRWGEYVDSLIQSSEYRCDHYLSLMM